MEKLVRLRCLREGSKLRVHIISCGYSSEVDCQIDKNIFLEGRELLVPVSDITLVETKEQLLYRIKSGRIEVASTTSPLLGMRVLGDESDNCVICMDSFELLIFAPCGHRCCCIDCSRKIDTCPLCREVIEMGVSKYGRY